MREILLNEMENKVINLFLNKTYTLTSFNEENETNFESINDINSFLKEGFLLKEKGYINDTKNNIFNYIKFDSIIKNMDNKVRNIDLEKLNNHYKNRFDATYKLHNNNLDSKTIDLFRMEIIELCLGILSKQRDLNSCELMYVEKNLSYKEIIFMFNPVFQNDINNTHNFGLFMYFIDRHIIEIKNALRKIDSSIDNKQQLFKHNQIKIKFVREFYSKFL